MISVIDHINKIKDKNHTIMSKDAEKALEKIQHIFVIKTLNILGTEETHLNIMKAWIYDSRHDMILHTENSKPSTKKELDPINESVKSQNTKINIQKWVAFLYKQQNIWKIKKTIHS